MKFVPAKILLLSCMLFVFTHAFSQSKFPVLSLQDNPGYKLEANFFAKNNASISADSAYTLLNGW